MVPAAEGKPTIANYLSLYTAAALAVWMPQHVFVCACVHVHAYRRGEIGKLLVVGFSLLKEERRNVEEAEEKAGRRGGGLRKTGRNMQSGYNRKQRSD